MAPTVEEKKKRRRPIHNLALAATKQVWMAPVVEEKKKQGCQNLHTCSSSNRASMDGTGNGKPKPSYAWHTTPDENLSAVTPKIWCDLHLLRILAKGRETPFLSSREGEIFSTFASLALTSHSKSRRYPRLLKRVLFLHPYPNRDHFTS